MTQVLLVRHAQSEWNAAGRWQGWADPPLTALGRAQAERAGARLRRTAAPIAHAVSSDLDRARTTAAIIAGIAGTAELVARRPPVHEVMGLRELDVGEWSGLTRAQIGAEWPDTLAEWEAGRLEAAPGGEDRADFDARVREAMTQVIADHPGGQLLVVAHGGVVRSVGRWLGAEEEPALHVAGFWIERDGRQPAITGAANLLHAEAAELDQEGNGAGEEPDDVDDRVPDDSAGAR